MMESVREHEFLESGKSFPREDGESRANSIAPALTPAPRRILVKEVNWLGDVVISLPALRAIRDTWPEALLAVLVKKELAGFFDGLDWVNETIPYSVARGLPGLFDRRRIIAAIRSRQFDLGVVFPNSFESALWITMAGIARRAGFIADARGAMLTHKILPPREAMTGHQSEYWLSMVRLTIGAETKSERVTLDAHGPHRDKMRQWLAENRKHQNAPLIAIAPAAAYGPAKEWPAARYGALVDLLAARDDAEVVLVGAPGEREKCVAVAAASKIGAVVAAGHTTVGELIALLSLCDGFIGNDSGCAHLAATLGIPTVAIFGSTNPERTAPVGNRARVIYRKLQCSPCLARTCRFGHYNCLTQIEPEELADAMRTLGAANSN